MGNLEVSQRLSDAAWGAAQEAQAVPARGAGPAGAYLGGRERGIRRGAERTGVERTS